MNHLSQKHCIPCKGGMPPLTEEEAQKFLAQAPRWKIRFAPDAPAKISKNFSFQNFREVMAFLNKVAEIAEAEGHHPDIEAHYREVTLTFFTHAIGGLSENDFIMATKIDKIAEK